MDVYGLEHVVQHLSGRPEQRQAMSEKAKARRKVEGLWGPVKVWCNVPGAASAELKVSLQGRDALAQVFKQQYPWGGGEAGVTSVPRMEAYLLSLWQERARCEEELALIAEELAAAIVYFSRRVGLLEAAASGAQAQSAHSALLGHHMRHNTHMLASFKAVATELGQQLM